MMKTVFLRESHWKNLPQDDELRVFFHNDYWHCMDTLRDLDILEKEWQHEKSFLEGVGVVCQISGN